ncbi:hypothetical protein BJ508DRAFT_326368 [Ascobolus immersus RN42]|uniref:F-box domain-containing protein n=1 Tax=Ascobolus immersus RN42 TaxID=1160509 RepID=A0A3N4I5W3_ASCIM|nr:hypothetical protein BJ508DRAFT_326368 [Ascobolus immersus RN42]
MTDTITSPSSTLPTDKASPLLSLPTELIHDICIRVDDPRTYLALGAANRRLLAIARTRHTRVQFAKHWFSSNCNGVSAPSTIEYIARFIRRHCRAPYLCRRRGVSRACTSGSRYIWEAPFSLSGIDLLDPSDLHGSHWNKMTPSSWGPERLKAHLQMLAGASGDTPMPYLKDLILDVEDVLTGWTLLEFWQSDAQTRILRGYYCDWASWRNTDYCQCGKEFSTKYRILYEVRDF